MHKRCLRILGVEDGLIVFLIGCEGVVNVLIYNVLEAYPAVGFYGEIFAEINGAFNKHRDVFAALAGAYTLSPDSVLSKRKSVINNYNCFRLVCADSVGACYSKTTLNATSTIATANRVWLR